MQTSTISNTVMRRVRFIHAVRPLLSGAALASVVFLIALWAIGREVWVAHVFQNMPSAANIAAVLRFYLSAFENTRFVVQVLLVLAFGAFIYALRDISRTITTSHRYAL